VVTYNSVQALPPLLDALVAQTLPGDQVVVVDNASDDASAAYALDRDDVVDDVVQTGHNAGFAAGAKRGAERVTADILLFLNPDLVPASGFLDVMRDAPDDWAAWTGLVLLPDGRVNAGPNEAHYLGFGWSGGYGAQARDIGAAPVPVSFLSGACLAIRRAEWEEVGGFSPEFFMYHEDLDLSHRLRLRGERFGLLPSARVVHDYEFHKGGMKWRLLERNRWYTMIRTYPGALLVVLVPALFAVEAFMVLVAARGGWLNQKVRAAADVLRALPRLREERRAIQATRSVSAADFARGLVVDLDSPFLGATGRSPVVRMLLRSYWSAARRVMPLLDRGGS
jgi:GT2 family glycosyltransferase